MPNLMVTAVTKFLVSKSWKWRWIYIVICMIYNGFQCVCVSNFWCWLVIFTIFFSQKSLSQWYLRWSKGLRIKIKRYLLVGCERIPQRNTTVDHHKAYLIQAYKHARYRSIFFEVPCVTQDTYGTGTYFLWWISLTRLKYIVVYFSIFFVLF